MSTTLEDLEQKYKQLGEEIERLKKEQKSNIHVNLERGMLFQVNDRQSLFDGEVYLLSRGDSPTDLRLICITDGMIWSSESIFGKSGRERFKYIGMAKDLVNIEIK